MLALAVVGWLIITVFGILSCLSGCAIQMLSGIGGAGRFEPVFPILVIVGGVVLYFSYLHCPFHLSFSSVAM